MTLANTHLVRLNYGRNGRFACEIESKRIVAEQSGPDPSPEFRDELAKTLAHPLDFPPLAQAVIPDDLITLALDRATPESPRLVSAVWDVLSKRRIDPANLTIVQPASMQNGELTDPRVDLPEDVREAVGWKLHDPSRKGECAYLASTSSGERVYLARDVTDADVVISIGQISFDSLLGYRGTNSVYYPGLSSAESLFRAHGQGHIELGPDDDRPLRQVIDEIGWLLGTQFTVQVLPSADGGVSHVLAGSTESVLRRGKELLAQDWLVELESRPEIVVAAVDADAGGHGWDQVGAALATARNLVARNGKIVVLTELEADLGAGMEIVHQSETPRDALKSLRGQSPPDLIAATQLAIAADWAKVYLLSRLESDIVEDLFVVPLENEKETARLLGSGESYAFLGTAQFTHGHIV